MTQLDPVLEELAAAHGVATEFGDWRGGGAQASSSAIVAVLGALGVDASSPEKIAEALVAAREEPWRRMLPVYVVARGGHASTVAVHVPHGAPAAVRLDLEDGGARGLTQSMVWVDPREIDGALVGEATFEIPDDVPLGYHVLRALSEHREASAQLIVVPDRLAPVEHRAWGFMVQLYAVRSRRSWSMGDLGDLRDLARWSGRELGAGFVLVNPLHAAAPIAPIEPSPYFPASRRFVNPIYLRVEDVAEVDALPIDAVESAAQPLQAKNGVDEDIDRDAVWRAKRRVLEQAFEHASRDGEFAEFVAAQGESLVDFATWCALAEVHGLPWTQWPQPLRDPKSLDVEAFRKQHRDLIDFHCWLQWLCSRQLDTAQAAALDAGMPIGVVHDLAVGGNPHGADAWAFSEVLAHGVTLGAPADMYNQQGQGWQLPPWRPDALAASGFAPYRDVLRAALAHGGGLRIDHVIGLFRQWWVPDGALPADGAYVRLDHEAMVGILLLEAARAGAVVIGEDLGNVEPWVREHLRERGVLGTSILWFEQDDVGAPRRAEQWREPCLATVTTHDLPPSAGYLTGEHVEIRAELGLLERDAGEERAADEAGRIAWLRALADAGLLDPDVVAAVTTPLPPGSVPPRRDHFAARIEPYLDRVVDALHAYIGRTPARLVGVYLPDVVGDRRPVNQPGTVDEFPNWRVPMTDAKGRPVLLDELMSASGPWAGRARRLALVVSGEAPSVTVASVGGSPP